MSVVATVVALGVVGLFPGRVDGLHAHPVGRVPRWVHRHPVGGVVGPNRSGCCSIGGPSLCLPLEGDIGVLVLTPPALFKHVAAVVEVDIDEPLVHSLQGVMLEVPVGLVVPAS